MSRILAMFLVRAKLLVAVAGLAAVWSPSLEAQATVGAEEELLETTLSRFCVSCHNDRLRTADMSLEGPRPYCNW